MKITEMNNCNLTTCRYNADGKCTNEEKRKECVRVSKAVLLIDDLVDTKVPDNQLTKEKNPFNVCDANPNCECDPTTCGFAVEYSTLEDIGKGIHRYMCGRDKCKYHKQKGVVRMKMTFDEKKAEIRKNIEELKEDIKILNKNISEFESVLDKVNSFDEIEQYEGMDIEKGLKHIEIF